MSGDYSSDGLFIDADTTVDEVVDFLERRTLNPHRIGDNIVWNYSSHNIDPDALEIVKEKDCSVFAIPYQVTGTWGMMFSMLPEQIREAEILVYRTDSDQYVAYEQFYRSMSNERREEFRVSLAKKLEETEL